MSSNKVALGLMAMLGVLFALQVSTCQGSPFMDPYFPESDEVEIVNLPEDQDQMDPNNNVNGMPTAGLKVTTPCFGLFLYPSHIFSGNSS